MRRLGSIAALVLVLAPPSEEPFRVFVTSSARGDPSVVETIDEGRVELENRIRKKKKSFVLAEVREEADVVIDLQAYWKREQWKTHTEIRRSATASHAIDVNEVEEHHSLLAIVTILGTPRQMTGAQIKKSGASVKGAARDLLEQIERYLKDNHLRKFR